MLYENITTMLQIFRIYFEQKIHHTLACIGTIITLWLDVEYGFTYYMPIYHTYVTLTRKCQNDIQGTNI